MVSVCTPLWHASYELAPWVLWGSAVCVSGLSGLARALLIVRLLTMNDDGGKSVDSSHIAPGTHTNAYKRITNCNISLQPTAHYDWLFHATHQKHKLPVRYILLISVQRSAKLSVSTLAAIINNQAFTLYSLCMPRMQYARLPWQALVIRCGPTEW
jgi:hypothetical protein